MLTHNNLQYMVRTLLVINFINELHDLMLVGNFNLSLCRINCEQRKV